MTDATLESVRIRGLLWMMLWIITSTILSFLQLVLPIPPVVFLLTLTYMKNKNDSDSELSSMVCFTVIQAASTVIAECISRLMIFRYGANIENFITYAMGGGLLTEKEYDLAVEDHQALLVQSPTTANDVGKVVLVKNGRLIVTRAAFMVFQIVMYLMGYFAGVQLEGRPSPYLGIAFVAVSSIFWIATFKIFAASYQYFNTMAKWVITHSIVIEIVTLSYCVRQDSFNASHIILQLFVGPYPIIFAVSGMKNPVDKLYTIYHAKNQIDAWLKKGHKLKSQICPTPEDDIEKGHKSLTISVE